MSQFTDELIYESQAISRSDISSILLGYSWDELRPDKNRRMIERKIASMVPDFRRSFPAGPTPKLPTRDLRVARTALLELQEWIVIKFPNYSLGSVHDKKIPPKEFFRWVVDREILKRLEDLEVTIRERAHRFVGFVHAERTDVAPQGTPGSSISSPAQSGSEPVNIEEFVSSLTFYFSDPCIFVRALNKRLTPYTLPSLGFRKPGGVTAQDLISILTNSLGPYYSLGPCRFSPCESGSPDSPGQPRGPAGGLLDPGRYDFSAEREQHQRGLPPRVE